MEWLSTVKKFLCYVCFDRIHERDGHTHTHTETDRQTPHDGIGRTYA